MSVVEEQLRAEVATLQDMLAQLRGSIDQVHQYRTAFSLPPRHARLLALLVNTRRPLSVETIYANVFEHSNGDGPGLDSVKVAVSEIRSRLGARGAPDRSIPSAFGTASYSLTPEFRTWLAAHLQPMECAA